MALKIRYFALAGIGETPDNPGGLMREVRGDDRFDVEYWDGSRWVDDPDLFKYTVGDDIFAEPITEEQAMAIIERWKTRELELARDALEEEVKE